MITAKNLGLQLEGDIILNDVSFSVSKGEYVGLIGPNGAGKSSLIKVILGFHKPSKGTLKVSPNVKIGYVPQSYLLSPVVPISVQEVLMMSGLTGTEKLAAQLQQVGLGANFLKFGWGWSWYFLACVAYLFGASDNGCFRYFTVVVESTEIPGTRGDFNVITHWWFGYSPPFGSPK